MAPDQDLTFEYTLDLQIVIPDTTFEDNVSTNSSKVPQYIYPNFPTGPCWIAPLTEIIFLLFPSQNIEINAVYYLSKQRKIVHMIHLQKKNIYEKIVILDAKQKFSFSFFC